MFLTIITAYGFSYPLTRILFLYWHREYKGVEQESPGSTIIWIPIFGDLVMPCLAMMDVIGKALDKSDDKDDIELGMIEGFEICEDEKK